MIRLKNGYSIRKRDRWNWELQRQTAHTMKWATKNYSRGDLAVKDNIVGFYPSLALAFARYCDLNWEGIDNENA